jgi:hypothetical protein
MTDAKMRWWVGVNDPSAARVVGSGRAGFSPDPPMAAVASGTRRV